MTGEMIDFDRGKFLRLKKVFGRAVQKGQVSFMFEGKELLTSYAKYLVEYLESRFGVAK